MKLLITGDWHLRFKRPTLRKDESYWTTQMNKATQVLRIAKTNDCDAIIQPGDLFDGEAIYYVMQHYINLFGEYTIPIYTVRGQHDLRYHSRNVENTPLAVLEAAKVIEVIDYKESANSITESRNVDFYGSDWNNEIPEIKESDAFNVLIAHKMIVDEKLWDGQTDFTYANFLFRKYDFDLFVFGDNHKHFVFDDGKGRSVFNCGSLMRANVNQIDHEPVCYIFDTEEKTFEQKKLRVASKDKVFDFVKYEKEKERNEELELFIEGLKSPEALGFDFLENLWESLKVTSVSKGVYDVLKEVTQNE